MPAMGIPVVIVPNGAPVSPGSLGTPVTIVGGNGASVVQDGQSVTVDNHDGSGSLITGAAQVSGGVVSVNLPGNAAIVLDNDLNQVVKNSDGSVGGAMQINVANNVPAFQLFNAVQRVATNAAPIQVTAGGKTVGATLAVNQGAFQPFPLSNATDAIVSSGDARQIPVTGTYVNTVTFTVAGGLITAITLS